MLSFLDVEFPGMPIGTLVWAVTGEGTTRKERNESIYLKLHGYPRAVNLKLADRIANVEHSAKTNPGLFEMYRSEQPRFREALEGFGDSRLWARLEKAFRNDT